MDFAGSFCSPELQAKFGLENFLSLAGMMMLAFGTISTSKTIRESPIIPLKSMPEAIFTS